MHYKVNDTQSLDLYRGFGDATKFINFIKRVFDVKDDNMM